MFQVLISSRTGYHLPTAGGGAPCADWKLRPLYRPPPFYPHHRPPASPVTPSSASSATLFRRPAVSTGLPTTHPLFAHRATQLWTIEDESLDIAVVSARIFGLRFSRLFGNKTGTSLHWYRLRRRDVSGFPGSYFAHRLIGNTAALCSTEDYTAISSKPRCCHVDVREEILTLQETSMSGEIRGFFIVSIAWVCFWRGYGSSLRSLKRIIACGVRFGFG